jgi:hypothetical protein
MASPNIKGLGTATQLALFSDSQTITGTPALTFLNGVLKAPAVSCEATFVTGQDVPPTPINVKATWNAERGGDVYSANFEYHATGNQQAAVHGPYISSWSDTWDAYGLDARVEGGTDAAQLYGMQFTVINNNTTVGPDAAAMHGIKVNMHGNTTDSTGLWLRGCETGIDVDGNAIIGGLKRVGTGLRPVYVDVETGKLVVGD